MVAAARQSGIDTEEALSKVSDKFIADFDEYEKADEDKKSSVKLYY